MQTQSLLLVDKFEVEAANIANTQDNTECILLHCAYQLGSVNLVQRLLSVFFSDTDITINKRCTPLKTGKQIGSVEVLPCFFLSVFSSLISAEITADFVACITVEPDVADVDTAVSNVSLHSEHLRTGFRKKISSSD